jgi:hypothetical protein
MTILATTALVVLIFVGILVLRMKSDPMEKESVRKLLADKPSAPEAASPTASSLTASKEPMDPESAKS